MGLWSLLALLLVVFSNFAVAQLVASRQPTAAQSCTPAEGSLACPPVVALGSLQTLLADWSNPSAVSPANGQMAQSGTLTAVLPYSRWLLVKSFGFSSSLTPGVSRVAGMEVSVECDVGGAGTIVIPASGVRVRTGGLVMFTSSTSQRTLTATRTKQVFGSPTTVWSSSSPSQFDLTGTTNNHWNSPEFAIAVAFRWTGGPSSVARVYNVSVTLYYSDPTTTTTVVVTSSSSSSAAAVTSIGGGGTATTTTIASSSSDMTGVFIAIGVVIGLLAVAGIIVLVVVMNKRRKNALLLPLLEEMTRSIDRDGIEDMRHWGMNSTETRSGVNTSQISDLVNDLGKAI